MIISTRAPSQLFIPSTKHFYLTEANPFLQKIKKKKMKDLSEGKGANDSLLQTSFSPADPGPAQKERRERKKKKEKGKRTTAFEQKKCRWQGNSSDGNNAKPAMSVGLTKAGKNDSRGKEEYNICFDFKNIRICRWYRRADSGDELTCRLQTPRQRFLSDHVGEPPSWGILDEFGQLVFIGKFNRRGQVNFHGNFFVGIIFPVFQRTNILQYVKFHPRFTKYSLNLNFPGKDELSFSSLQKYSKIL